MSVTLIPKGEFDSAAPCWIPTTFDGKATRPILRCQCGEYLRIYPHHIHADGIVTASWFHAKEAIPNQDWAGGGCDWHVWLKLLDYDQGEFK